VAAAIVHPVGVTQTKPGHNCSVHARHAPLVTTGPKHRCFTGCGSRKPANVISRVLSRPRVLSCPRRYLPLLLLPAAGADAADASTPVLERCTVCSNGAQTHSGPPSLVAAASTCRC
jgi:hypothetical protein